MKNVFTSLILGLAAIAAPAQVKQHVFLDFSYHQDHLAAKNFAEQLKRDVSKDPGYVLDSSQQKSQWRVYINMMGDQGHVSLGSALVFETAAGPIYSEQNPMFFFSKDANKAAGVFWENIDGAIADAVAEGIKNPQGAIAPPFHVGAQPIYIEFEYDNHIGENFSAAIEKAVHNNPNYDVQEKKLGSGQWGLYLSMLGGGGRFNSPASRMPMIAGSAVLVRQTPAGPIYHTSEVFEANYGVGINNVQENAIKLWNQIDQVIQDSLGAAKK